MDEIKFFFDEPLEINLIEETFYKSFKKPIDTSYWNWRFKKNATGDKVFISYIKDKDTLAAYYAVSPCILEKEGKIYGKIALSNMTMTHPAYQGKGYFQKLSLALYEELRKSGYIGIFGFANQNSHYGFRKYLNWHDLSHLNVFRADKESFRESMIKTVTSFSFETVPIDNEILKKIEQFSFSTGKYNLARNFEFMSWRLVEIPTNKYQVLLVKTDNNLAGALVFKVYEENIDLMEFFYHSEFANNSNEILGACIKELIAKLNLNVCMWSNIHSEEHLYLEKIGFAETDFITYFGVIPLIDDMQLLEYKNWHYRFIDSDVF